MLYWRTSGPEGGTCGPKPTGPPVQPKCGNALPASLWGSSVPCAFARNDVYAQCAAYGTVMCLATKPAQQGPSCARAPLPARRSGLVLHAAELHSQVPEGAAEASLVVDRQQWPLTGVAASIQMSLAAVLTGWPSEQPATRIGQAQASHGAASCPHVWQSGSCILFHRGNTQRSHQVEPAVCADA